MSDKELIQAWGRWFAQLHQSSKRFSEKYPEIASNVQRWDQIHEKIMKDAPIHEDDKSIIGNPDHYGIIHGDLNTTNFHFINDEN